MGASCTSVKGTPVGENDQDQQPTEREAPKETEEEEAVVSGSSTADLSDGKRQQSTISTSSRYLNSLTGGNAEPGDSVILQPVRRPPRNHLSHQQHQNHHQQQSGTSSTGQGPIHYRLNDVRPFAGSQLVQLMQQQQQRENVEDVEESENRYDQSLVQRYLGESTAVSSSGRSGRGGRGGGGGKAITVAKSKLQVGKFQLSMKKTKRAVAGANSSSTSTSFTSSLTSATSRSPLNKSSAQEVAGKRTFSRLSVDSEKTIYLFKAKTASTEEGASLARPQLHLQLPKSQSLIEHSRERVIEQVKSTAQVPTPPVLQVRGYVFQRLVASGAHSNLYQVVSYSLHNQELACKHINKAGFANQTEQWILRAFLDEETAILERVKHRNIVRMLEIITTASDVYIIMNFASNGTIFDYLYKEWKKPLPETYARRWFRHLFSALEYLHYSLKIVHRDLKLENFLLTEHYIALLSDFGLAVQLDQPQAKRLLSVHCGTKDYMAPELNVTNHAGGHYHVDPLPADIYAMGVSLFEVLNSYRPFAISFSASSHSVLYRQHHRLYRLNRRVILEQSARDLLEVLLEPKPSLRPTATAVLAHSWFKGQTAS